jgi:hypothetical protein
MHGMTFEYRRRAKEYRRLAERYCEDPVIVECLIELAEMYEREAIRQSGAVEDRPSYE